MPAHGDEKDPTVLSWQNHRCQDAGSTGRPDGGSPEAAGHGRLAKKLLDTKGSTPASAAPGHTAGGRRLTKKTSESSNMHQVSVTYTSANPWRGRRVAGKDGAQSMDRRMQRVLLQHTYDIDVKNCCFSLLPQIVERLDLQDKEFWADELSLLKRLSEDRGGFCRDCLGVEEAYGKHWAMVIVNGGAPPKALEKNAYAQQLANLGRWVRWLACTMLPGVLKALKEGQHAQDKKFPEASCASYMWSGVEDMVACSLAQHLRQKTGTHLSLHFDGVRVDKNRCKEYGGEAEICRALEKVVKDTTGYDVGLAIKHHDDLRTMVKHLPDTGATPITDHLLLRTGNCIPLAIAALTDTVEAVTASVAASDGDRTRPPSSRTYREASELLQVQLAPFLSVDDLEEGKWLVHCEAAGTPPIAWACTSSPVTRSSSTTQAMHLPRPWPNWWTC